MSYRRRHHIPRPSPYPKAGKVVGRSSPPELKINEKTKSLFLLEMEKQISNAINGYPLTQELDFEEFVGGFLAEEDAYNLMNGGGYMGRFGASNRETAKVWIDDQKAVLCARFPYRANVIEDIRVRIPKGKKAWQPEKGIWEFSIECIDDIVDILNRAFPDLINLTDILNPPPIQQNGVAKDTLLSLLDKEDINAIYRLLAKKYHPDLGGDGEKMSKINELFKAKS